MGEYRTETDGTLPPSLARRRRRRRRWVAGLVATLFVVAALLLLVRVEGTVVATGYVTSEEHAEVRAAVPGVVAEILARTGDGVARDALLVRLDDREERAVHDEVLSRYRKAEAELALRRAEIEEAIRVRRERIHMADLRLAHAEERLERIRELTARGLAAGAALADEEHQVRLLTLERDTLRDRTEDIATHEIEVLDRELEARRDAVTVASSRLLAREIRAPIAGQVLRYSFVVGEMVRPDAVLIEIFGGDRQVLKLRVVERYAMRVQPGDRAEARLGAYRGSRGMVFSGQVEFLRNVIQGEDRNPYRAVYCSFDPGGRDVPPGTTAEARIFTGKKPLWRWLTGWD